jgi:hypothetical protein
LSPFLRSTQYAFVKCFTDTVYIVSFVPYTLFNCKNFLLTMYKSSDLLLTLYVLSDLLLTLYVLSELWLTLYKLSDLSLTFVRFVASALQVCRQFCYHHNIHLSHFLLTLYKLSDLSNYRNQFKHSAVKRQQLKENVNIWISNGDIQI